MALTTGARPVEPHRAQVTRGGDGAVTFDDPGSPWLVRIWTQTVRGRVHLTSIHVEVRNPNTPGLLITSARLGRLPVGQMLHVAAVSEDRYAHPDETWYRLLADSLEPGQRTWPDSHWDLVLTVYQWATETKRPGGGRKAIADIWRVSRNPTARRWHNTARARAAARDNQEAS